MIGNRITNYRISLMLTLLLIGATGRAQTQGGMATQKQASITPSQTNLGAKVGFVQVDTIDDIVLSVGAFGDYALDEQFLVGASLDYWNETSGRLSNNPVAVSNLSIGAHGRWIFTKEESAFQPYALAGLAIHRLKVTFSRRRDDDDRAINNFRKTYEDVEGEVGVDLAGGVMYKVASQIDALGEIRFRNLFDAKVGFDQVAFTGSLLYRL